MEVSTVVTIHTMIFTMVALADLEEPELQQAPQLEDLDLEAQPLVPPLPQEDLEDLLLLPPPLLLQEELGQVPLQEPPLEDLEAFTIQCIPFQDQYIPQVLSTHQVPSTHQVRSTHLVPSIHLVPSTHPDQSILQVQFILKAASLVLETLVVALLLEPQPVLPDSGDQVLLLPLPPPQDPVLVDLEVRISEACSLVVVPVADPLVLSEVDLEEERERYINL